MGKPYESLAEKRRQIFAGKKRVYSVSLSEKTHAEAKKAAKARGVSLSEYVSELIRKEYWGA